MNAQRTDSAALAAIVGTNEALRAALARAVRVAATGLPVLVTGESGTGKELLARLLHEHGPRPAGPFVAVNCGALSRELAESELFGHERGAFTGATGRRAGWFEEAAGGTLVLDEVGELPLDLQPKLLRVLETGRLRRVGGQGEIAVAVRVVAMTLRDLRQEAARGRFRLDLYHRLAGFEVALPPLRRRPEDIPLLVARFLGELEPEVGPRVVDPAALARLQTHDWPGNVRELRNVVRRAAWLAGPTIGVGDLELGPPVDVDLPARGWPSRQPGAWSEDLALPRAPSWPEARAADAPGAPVGVGPGGVGPAALIDLRGRRFAELERAIFTWALRTHGGSRRQAAAALGISRSTFCDRVKRLGIGAASGGGLEANAG